jgi:aliphatic nitrilase
MKGNEEGIVEAEINLEDCVKKKIIQDFAGHYNRPDVFSLRVNTSVPKIFQFEGSDPSLPEEEARSRKGFQEGEKPDPNTNSQKS